ncbi:MAG: hypothetical protein WCL23_02380 [Candidatus Moraniibacteriota bacterium]
MDRTTHRIRKRLIVSLVATFLSLVMVGPSVPVRNPAIRNTVSAISAMNDESREEKVDPEEDPGREESRSVETNIAGAAG